MFNAKPFNPKAYQGWRGALELPRSIRTYFDGCAHEWNDIDERQKLLNLGYVLKRGYDLGAQIKACLYDRPHISESTFKSSLRHLIKFADKDYFEDNGYDLDTDAYSIDDYVSFLHDVLDEHYVEYHDDTHELR